MLNASINSNMLANTTAITFGGGKNFRTLATSSQPPYQQLSPHRPSQDCTTAQSSFRYKQSKINELAEKFR